MNPGHGGRRYCAGRARRARAPYSEARAALCLARRQADGSVRLTLGVNALRRGAIELAQRGAAEVSHAGALLGPHCQSGAPGVAHIARGPFNALEHFVGSSLCHQIEIAIDDANLIALLRGGRRREHCESECGHNANAVHG